MTAIRAVAMLNALGNDLSTIAANLTAGQAPGMEEQASGWLQTGNCAVARVTGALPSLPRQFARHDSRNNRLLLAALNQLSPQLEDVIQCHGRDRVAVVMGTSTSGLDEGDARVSAERVAAWRYDQQELGDPARFISQALQLDGPSLTISTACSSSARAIITGKRLIDAGIVDAALVGGADTLSRMPINGFHSLESLSLERCAPFSKDRCGITIGEGAALLLLTRDGGPVVLKGVGESSDAWHMSAPHPEGEGAGRAIRMALIDAGLAPDDIGYINMHGTATRLNDDIEARIVNRLFGDRVPASSVKHLIGHTLGAAGAMEAALCWLILTRKLALPPQDFSRHSRDETLPPCGLLTAPAPLARPWILSNAFAFGGNNTSLILGRNDEPF